MAEWSNCIVIDTGTSTTKAGFSSDLGPRVELPTRLPSDVTSSGDIMQRGIVVNYEKLTRLWSHLIYDRLGVKSPDEFAIYFTEKPLNPKANREKTFQILFEEFEFAAVSFSQNSSCSLFGAGRLTGTVLDLGGGCSIIMPVYGGYTLPHAVQFLHVSGDDITKYLASMLSESKQLTEPVKNDIARTIKENTAYVSANPETEEPLLPHNYRFPDGKVVSIGTERHRCTELLFSPSLLGKSDAGIHHAIKCAYQRLESSAHSHKSLRNLTLAGGTSLLPGIQERVQRELALMQPVVTLNTLPNRKYLAWYGASLVTSLSNFSQSEGTHTKQEYDESGPSLVHRKIY